MEFGLGREQFSDVVGGAAAARPRLTPDEPEDHETWLVNLRADSAGQRLGLALCRMIIKQHEGNFLPYQLALAAQFCRSFCPLEGLA
jgi:hypothetical protein